MSNKAEKKKLLIPVKKLQKGVTVPRPSKLGDAGADARIIGFKRIIIQETERELQEVNTDSYILKPLERIGCSLGFATAIPKGYYFKVVPRSGLALWEGLSILNSPGTIDSGYRNEWMAIVINLSNTDVTLKKGDRICQIILTRIVEYQFEEVDELSESDRGQGGFGSTGKE